ncbi:MAG: class I SAM-dependent methyltransferase [Planctomycetaceae bacterium]
MSVGAQRHQAFPGIMVNKQQSSVASADDHSCCPACGRPEHSGSRILRFDSARGAASWMRCQHCGAYHLVGQYDVSAEAGHTTSMPWGQLQSGVQLNDFKKRMFEAALSGIRKHAPDARTILDVGCSFGGFLFAARQRGYAGSGIDIVPEAVEYVRGQGFDAEACESLTDCHLFSEQNPVDVLAVLDAHIYWPNQPAELAAAWKLIRPGGLLVMRVITKAHFVSAGLLIRSIAPKFGDRLIRRSVIDHRFCMPLKSLLETIERSGFHIESVVPGDAQHSDHSSLPVRSLFAVGDFIWKVLRCHIAPGAMIYARKPLQ